MNATAIPAEPPRAARPEDFHPLEIIPYFRRWPSSVPRDVLYTLIWNTGLALVFWVNGAMFRPLSLTALLGVALYANVIGYTLHALFLVAGALGLDRRVRRHGGLATTLYYAGLCTFGVVAGMGIILAVAGGNAPFGWLTRPTVLSAMAVSSVVISSIIALIFFSRERQAQAEASLARERVRNERVEREAAAANLRALQAQIEPHFLFNTLANVAGLIDPDPAKAKRMLESFNRFLRSSLAATRTEATTLGAEADLIAAYLDVLQVRMEGRLRYRVEVPPELASFELAPMLLQPIVENAIRHGLEPKVEGGEVRLAARREGPSVVVEIADTGVGFGSATRGGLGLTNVRDRLRLLHGERGGLEIAENAPAGTRVSLRFPA